MVRPKNKIKVKILNYQINNINYQLISIINYQLLIFNYQIEISY